MLLPIIALVIGLIILVISADKFVDGSVGVAQYFGMSKLLIGMVIIGFGTSAPELVVSALSALNNSPQLALGNAYGSNIANIALILGVTSMISPVLVKRESLKRDVPILIFITILSFILISDGSVSTLDALIILGTFIFIMLLNIFTEIKSKKTSLDVNEKELTKKQSLFKSFIFLVSGLTLLIVSSRILVWGAIEMARFLGVSDLLIGLTVVAIGTSLPELASSIIAASKGEDDLAFGNIVGSNLFNTLAVVGVAAIISPIKSLDSFIFSRDLPVVFILTILLLFFGLPIKKNRVDVNGNKIGRINKLEGFCFLLIYFGYLTLIIVQAI